MERLTKAADDLTFLCDHLRRETKFDAQRIKDIHDRLAAYEDAEDEERLIVFESAGNRKHIQELAEADKDGRCVVLPCKVEHLQKMLDGLTSGSSVDAGETYTTGYLYGWKNGRAELLRYILGMPDGGTREAAEAALEAQK